MNHADAPITRPRRNLDRHQGEIGSAAGALLTKNIFLTVAIFLVLFVFCSWKALRSYDRK
jgi:hypothetical protein